MITSRNHSHLASSLPACVPCYGGAKELNQLVNVCASQTLRSTQSLIHSLERVKSSSLPLPSSACSQRLPDNLGGYSAACSCLKLRREWHTRVTNVP